MKYLFLALLTTCNTYTGVIVSNDNINSVDVKINEYHYILPILTWSQYDTLEIGDTIYIDKQTLKMIR